MNTAVYNFNLRYATILQQLNKKDAIVEDFFKNGHSTIVSCFAKPNAKIKNQKFIFDIDSFEMVNELKQISEFVTPETVYKTKNGFHIVTPAFNHTQLPMELKKLLNRDSLLLLFYPEHGIID